MKTGDRRAVPFNMLSGTSMACPHVIRIAAYVKTFNPTWSPAAIKSALMTTPSPMSAQINTDAEFSYGAGNLNPIKATRTGLVYDATQHIRIIPRVNTSSCSGLMEKTKDLNYPTFVIPTLCNQPVSLSFNRTVTNVGYATSTYRSLITQPRVSGLRIVVRPNVLQFEEIGQKLSFTVCASKYTTTARQPDCFWCFDMG